jgi:hypothetical protein
VALSAIEEKYMVTSTANCEAIWLSKLHVGLFDQEFDPTVIYCITVVSNSLRIQCFMTGPST